MLIYCGYTTFPHVLYFPLSLCHKHKQHLLQNTEVCKVSKEFLNFNLKDSQLYLRQLIYGLTLSKQLPKTSQSR